MTRTCPRIRVNTSGRSAVEIVVMRGECQPSHAVLPDRGVGVSAAPGFREACAPRQGDDGYKEAKPFAAVVTVQRSARGLAAACHPGADQRQNAEHECKNAVLDVVMVDSGPAGFVAREERRQLACRLGEVQGSDDDQQDA